MLLNLEENSFERGRRAAQDKMADRNRVETILQHSKVIEIMNQSYRDPIEDTNYSDIEFNAFHSSFPMTLCRNRSTNEAMVV